LYFVTQSHVIVAELQTFLKTKGQSEVLNLKCGDNVIYMEGVEVGIQLEGRGWNNAAADGTKWAAK
jgi:hypothetical protein